MTRRLSRLPAIVLAIGIAACAEPNSGIPPQDAPPPDPMAASYLQGAMRMARSGNFEGAIEAVERARRIAPSWSDVYTVRGQVLIAARDFPSAREALEHAVTLDSNDARAWEMLGHARYQSRQFREAIAAYERAAVLEQSPFLWQGIGAAYQELFRPDSAESAYRRVLELDSTFAPAWAALSQIAEDEGAYAEALRMAARATRVSPRTVAYQFARARLLVRTERPGDAIPILKEIVQRDSTHYGALYNLGLAYHLSGQTAEAERMLERSARVRTRMTERKPL